MEDTLKNALYFHLRNELGDDFLLENRLRIFTEYHLDDENGNKQKIDLAIVRLKEGKYDYIKDKIHEVLSIVELKFKNGGNYGIKKDIKKIKNFYEAKGLKNCKFYLGVVYEDTDFPKEHSWLYKDLDNSWTKNVLTELTAHYNNAGEMASYIISHYK